MILSINQIRKTLIRPAQPHYPAIFCFTRTTEYGEIEGHQRPICVKLFTNQVRFFFMFPCICIGKIGPRSHTFMDRNHLKNLDRGSPRPFMQKYFQIRYWFLIQRILQKKVIQCLIEPRILSLFLNSFYICNYA